MTMLDAQSQRAARLLMVRPAAFGYNADAAASNAFATPSSDPVDRAARAEFNAAVATLEAADIEVIVLEDQADPKKPDAVFPNNWVSLHADGTMITYAMANENRRTERVPERLVARLEKAGLRVDRHLDLSSGEADGAILEGTGSLILDHPRRRAFASRSGRTTASGVKAFEAATGWDVHLFDAADSDGAPIYHTNVLMSLGERIAILCNAVIAEADRDALHHALADSGRTIVEISREQMHDFCGNVIEVETRGRAPRMLMSTRAYAAFTPAQRAEIERLSGPIITCDIATIETVGGGSLRCMIAEAPLPHA